MAEGTTEPKRGGSGSWWTTLPGVLTAVATLLTAVGGLIGVLYQVHILPLSQSPPPPVPLPEPPSQYKGIGQKVDGVEVKILRVQRISERDATLLQLDYSVTTGSELRWHDPDHFAQLILEGAAVAPVWTSTWAGDLPLNSVKEFSVKFRAPPGAAQSVVFRFGEEHHIDLLATVLDRN